MTRRHEPIVELGGQKHRKRPRPREMHWARLLLMLVPALACGESFAPGSEVRGLRVFGVQKDRPYAAPGETVELSLLWHYAPVPEDVERGSPRQPPEIAWLALCDNPAGDAFELCFAQLPGAAETTETGASEGSGTEEPFALDAAEATRISLPTDPLRANDRFELTLPLDLITSRSQPLESNPRPYGISFVFFLACNGRLGWTEGDEQFPLACYAADGISGLEPGAERLGADQFVFGYTAVYAYEQLSNENPQISGVQLGEQVLRPGQGGLTGGDLCVGQACLDEPADRQGPCAPALTLDCSQGCDELPLRPLMDPTNAEQDAVGTELSGRPISEQMWINYYAAGGSVAQEVRLLNDADLGWNEDLGTAYTPPSEAGVSFVWAVAHDNRGGSQWLRLRLCTSGP